MSTLDYRTFIRHWIQQSRDNNLVREQIYETLDTFASQLEEQLRLVYGRNDLYVTRKKVSVSTEKENIGSSQYALPTNILGAHPYDVLLVTTDQQPQGLEICSIELHPATVWPVRMQFQRCALSIHNQPALESALEKLTEYQTSGILEWLDSAETLAAGTC